MENSSDDGAMHLVEKLRKTTEDLNVGCEEKEIKITVSIGVAKIKDEETLEDLIHRSDAALYRAKEKGRNRVSQ